MLPFAEEAVFGGKLLRAAGDTEHAMSAAARAGSEIDASLNLTAKQARLLENQATGNAYRDEIAQFLRSNSNNSEVLIEVPIKTIFGSRRYDIGVYRGFGADRRVIGLVETKTGNSPYLASQRAKDWYVQHIKKIPVNLIRRP